MQSNQGKPSFQKRCGVSACLIKDFRSFADMMNEDVSDKYQLITIITMTFQTIFDEASYFTKCINKMLNYLL